ncbi:protein suppressor of hairy wing-like, partial [Teleopsis dalmanni]
MSHDVLKTISIKDEGGPNIDFSLTDNDIVKSEDKISNINDRVHLDADGTKETVEDRTEKHKCDNCSKSFKVFGMLKKHLAVCYLNSSYHSRKAEMIKNIQKIEEDAVKLEQENICFCCGESYDTFHRGKINCFDCPKSFKTQLSYERHIFIIHSEFDEFPCSICNAKLRTATLLKLHEKQHASLGRLWACKICGRDFTRSFHLKRHQKYTSCAGSLKKTITCKVCNKVFSGVDSLRKHLKRHFATQLAKIKEFMCPICKNSFPSLSILKKHKRRHKEKRFICDFCGKKFLSGCQLKDHRHSHTGETPYICTECNQSFTTKYALNNHMKRHTGEK